MFWTIQLPMAADELITTEEWMRNRLPHAVRVLAVSVSVTAVIFGSATAASAHSLIWMW